jgi:hypothetical protein
LGGRFVFVPAALGPLLLLMRRGSEGGDRVGRGVWQSRLRNRPSGRRLPKLFG